MVFSRRAKYFLLLFIVTIAIASLLFALLLSKDRHNSVASWKTYNNPSVSFSYPSDWQFSPCADGKPPFTLPGTINGQFKTDNYPLVIRGSLSIKYCSSENNFTLNVSPQNISDINEECTAHNRGEKLRNGLYLDMPDFQDDKKEVWLIVVEQDYCYTQATQSLASFSFSDKADSVSADTILRYGGEPRVDKKDFLASQQYRDIKRFAESIQLKP